MLASVLNSGRAVKISIVIIKTFVHLREIIYAHKELLLRLQALEVKYANHDSKIQLISEAIKKLLEPAPEPPLLHKPLIGFHRG